MPPTRPSNRAKREGRDRVIFQPCEGDECAVVTSGGA